MANGKTVIDAKTANVLAEELSRLGREMLLLGKKFEKLTSASSVKKVKITPETDPDMFTKEFIRVVKKARHEIEQGKTVDYFEFRKTLGL